MGFNGTSGMVPSGSAPAADKAGMVIVCRVRAVVSDSTLGCYVKHRSPAQHVSSHRKPVYGFNKRN